MHNRTCVEASGVVLASVGLNVPEATLRCYVEWSRKYALFEYRTIACIEGKYTSGALGVPSADNPQTRVIRESPSFLHLNLTRARFTVGPCAFFRCLTVMDSKSAEMAARR